MFCVYNNYYYFVSAKKWTQTWNLEIKIVRRNFLYDLSYELVKPLMARRLTFENLPRELKNKTKWLLGHTDEQ